MRFIKSAGILVIVNRKCARKPDVVGVFAKKPGADGMERPGPADRVASSPNAPRAVSPRMRPTRRVISAAPAREVNNMIAARIGAVFDEMHDTMRQRSGLARARAGND